MAGDDAVAQEIPGLNSLRHLFAKALWKPKFDSAWCAWTEMQAATGASERTKIVEQRFEEWRSGCVCAIRQHFPQFVQLGSTYRSQRLQPGIVEWVEGEMWRLLSRQCGAERPGGQINIADRGQLNAKLHAAKWWFSRTY